MLLLWIRPTGADLSPDIPFWLTAAGGILLVLGRVFNKICRISLTPSGPDGVPTDDSQASTQQGTPGFPPGAP
jgi:hypothetical protein